MVRWAGAGPCRTMTPSKTATPISMSMMRKHLTGFVEVLILALLLIGLLGSGARAASIRIETKVAGYPSVDWVLVLPEMRGVLGGRVRYDDHRRCWITGRVQRGEPVRITVTPTTTAELTDNEAVLGISPANGGKGESYEVLLPYVHMLTIPADSDVWELTVGVQNSASGWLETLIFIGARP